MKWGWRALAAIGAAPGRQRLSAVSTAGLALLLSGCASFDGQAVPVFKLSGASKLVSEYAPAAALAEFYRETDQDKRKLYRDRVIGIYLAAADTRYLEFRSHLSREMKGSNVLLGVLALGLTGGASIAGESTANILSAGAAGAIGTRTTVSKELWFEKTLPALMTAMAANRTKIRTEIMVRMQEPASSYPLAEAFADIARYQEAASLDGAIETVTSAAADKNAEADAIYASKVAFSTPPPEAGVAELRAGVKRALGASQANPAKVIAAASAVDLDLPEGTPALAASEAIMTVMLKLHTQAETKAFADKVQAALKEP